MNKSNIVLGAALLALTALVNTGCGNKGKHDHGGKGKNNPPAKSADGWLFAEPGHNFHIHLDIDKAAKKATAKVMDEAAKELVPIGAEVITLNIKGSKDQIVLKGEAAKDKKRAVFAGSHDRFSEKLDPEKLELTAEIDGKNLIFELDEDHKR